MSISTNSNPVSASSTKMKSHGRGGFTHLYQELQMYPNLHLKQLMHKFSLSNSEAESSALQAQINTILSENEMGPFCTAYFKESTLIPDLNAKNISKIAEFDEQIVKANEGLSQNDVVELMLSKAIYLCQIGDKIASIFSLRQLEEKCPTSGARLDFAFAAIRIGLLWDDMDIVKRNIIKAER